MDPRDFQTLAKSLAAGSTAADYRTAISRAYYAAYNVAADLLTSMGVILPQTGEAHQEVRDHLLCSREKVLVNQSPLLHTLRGLRAKADYQLRLAEPEQKKNAEKAIALADQVIARLDDFSAWSDERKEPAAKELRKRSNRPGRQYT